MAVALHGFEAGQHGDCVLQQLGGGVETDVQGHVWGQQRKVDGQKLVEVDGGNLASIECGQDSGLDQRDTSRAFAVQQVDKRAWAEREQGQGQL